MMPTLFMPRYGIGLKIHRVITLSSEHAHTACGDKYSLEMVPVDFWYSREQWRKCETACRECLESETE